MILRFTGQALKRALPRKIDSRSITSLFSDAGKRRMKAIVKKWRGPRMKNTRKHFANGKRRLKHLTVLLRTSKGKIFPYVKPKQFDLSWIKGPGEWRKLFYHRLRTGLRSGSVHMSSLSRFHLILQMEKLPCNREYSC